VTTRARRRRSAVLIALAIACGGLAASRVETRAGEVERQVGPLVPVVVARADLPAGTKLTAGRLAVRQVPERFAPRDSLASAGQALGLRLAGPLAAGSYLTDGVLAERGSAPDDDAPAGAAIRRGERSVEVAVAAGESLAEAPPGARVDVLVTTEPRTGAGRTYLALQNVELLAARPAGGESGGGGDGAAARATTIATLRVTLREAVYLTAAQSFARELRLLVRAPGDRRSAGALAVDGGRL
jgi:pilus assembly protein CpaB